MASPFLSRRRLLTGDISIVIRPSRIRRGRFDIIGGRQNRLQLARIQQRGDRAGSNCRRRGERRMKCGRGEVDDICRVD